MGDYFHKKGRGRSWQTGSVYEVEEGDVMAVFPGQLHSIYGVDDQRMDYENIIFSLSLLMGTEEDLCTERYLLPLVREQVREPLFMRKGMKGYEPLTGVSGRWTVYQRREGADTSWQ
mgnify:CR=1 FL=1